MENQDQSTEGRKFMQRTAMGYVVKRNKIKHIMIHSFLRDQMFHIDFVYMDIHLIKDSVIELNMNY